jgi:predicted MFS family arabinose efflux permease
VPELDERRLSLLITLMAVGAGVVVANIYYAQPLLNSLRSTFGSSQSATADVVTLAQLGYAVGIVVFVPLGDVLDDKRLVLRVLGLSVLAAAGCAVSPSLPVFLIATVLAGATAVVAQILTPMAARISPPERRGALVGRVTGGLVTGILLARAFAGLVASVSSWRVVYAVSAAAMVVLFGLLARFLPRRGAVGELHVGRLLVSLAELVRSEPLLRRRALYQSTMFAAFSMFWTSITYELAAHGVGQAGIGLFALVGAGGALAAPVAGRLADRGHGRGSSGAALVIAAVALVVGWAGQSSIVALAVAAVLLDLAVQGSNVLGQQAIYSRRPESRSRMNTVYIATFFFAGALGSALSGVLWARAGWSGVVLTAAVLPALGFLRWLAEVRTSRTPAS